MRDDGGPAFPQTQTLDPGPGRGFVSGLDVAEGGMTMRDYFAAKAMNAVIQQKDIHDGREFVNCAWISYQIADAMLAERNKGQS